MNINRATLQHVAATIAQLPPQNLPEYVFAGRSNVGKSSLLNVLAGRKALARTSSEPGKTRTINFYNLDDRWMFVDLPGYGYAKTAHAEQERFSGTIDYYLNHRSAIQMLFLLVDIRHEPSADDRMMADFALQGHFPFAVILTKSDKLSKSQIFRNTAMIRKSLNLPEAVTALPFSALNRSGKEEIWALIDLPEPIQTESSDH